MFRSRFGVYGWSTVTASAVAPRLLVLPRPVLRQLPRGVAERAAPPDWRLVLLVELVHPAQRVADAVQRVRRAGPHGGHPVALRNDPVLRRRIQEDGKLERLPEQFQRRVDGADIDHDAPAQPHPPIRLEIRAQRIFVFRARVDVVVGGVIDVPTCHLGDLVDVHRLHHPGAVLRRERRAIGAADDLTEQRCRARAHDQRAQELAAAAPTSGLEATERVQDYAARVGLPQAVPRVQPVTRRSLRRAGSHVSLLASSRRDPGRRVTYAPSTRGGSGADRSLQPSGCRTGRARRAARPRATPPRAAPPPDRRRPAPRGRVVRSELR